MYELVSTRQDAYVNAVVLCLTLPNAQVNRRAVRRVRVERNVRALGQLGLLRIVCSLKVIFWLKMPRVAPLSIEHAANKA